jgi:hypothetical protein
MWSKYMAKAKFTQDQLNEAVAEFFADPDASIEWGLLPAAGNNGPITVYKLEKSDGTSQAASE